VILGLSPRFASDVAFCIAIRYANHQYPKKIRKAAVVAAERSE